MARYDAKAVVESDRDLLRARKKIWKRLENRHPLGVSRGLFPRGIQLLN